MFWIRNVPYFSETSCSYLEINFLRITYSGAAYTIYLSCAHENYYLYSHINTLFDPKTNHCGNGRWTDGLHGGAFLHSCYVPRYILLCQIVIIAKTPQETVAQVCITHLTARHIHIVQNQQQENCFKSL